MTLVAVDSGDASRCMQPCRVGSCCACRGVTQQSSSTTYWYDSSPFLLIAVVIAVVVLSRAQHRRWHKKTKQPVGNETENGCKLEAFFEAAETWLGLYETARRLARDKRAQLVAISSAQPRPDLGTYRQGGETAWPLFVP